MMVNFRIGRALLQEVREDLDRPHAFAFERVGFLFCRFGSLPMGGLVVLGREYSTVADEDYINDDRFGAVVGAGAFRSALERTLTDALGIFHVHMHSHRGTPFPSPIDLRETAKFVPDFFHVQGAVPHGALIVSRDEISGRVWLGEDAKPIEITATTVIGSPLLFRRSGR